MAEDAPKLNMLPNPGEGLLRFVGDRVSFQLRLVSGAVLPGGWGALLRTNLGRSRILLAERVQDSPVPTGGMAWRDLPMRPEGNQWVLELPLTEVGFFEAKAYAVNPQGRQFWPEGPNVGISVHPDEYRTRNTIYCAFVRLFGETRGLHSTREEWIETQLADLDRRNYTVIPPSGKLRDLTQEVPHILDRLGCRIIHLLPVNPTPTTYARMGRFGSPYACLRLTGIDPALVVFDRRTTAVDQFKELTRAVHTRNGRVFLDLAINHTGWGSDLHEEHPEWYFRDSQGSFVSPGAWGTTWEDLCELDHAQPELWRYLADVFLVWCRRGVDGFRCDAGYKVPVAAWQYITARVRQEFPSTVFLLEGLGGAWSDTERLLTEGGMQWAYSELFQNYSGPDIASYLDYSLRQSRRLGLWVHYSETHDNDRLAKLGRAWSLLRNQLCALTSVSGGYGFTCGVEWLALERVNVHQSYGLAWGNPNNLIPELERLNRLLSDHPCFFDHAQCTRLSRDDSPVYALRRDSAEGVDCVLVLVNTDLTNPQTWAISKAAYQEMGRPSIELLGQESPRLDRTGPDELIFTLPPATVYCLSGSSTPRGLWGEDYRQARAQAAWAYQAINQVLALEDMGLADWRWLARRAGDDPRRFLQVLNRLKPEMARGDLQNALESAWQGDGYPKVIEWELIDRRRVTWVPVDHWLLIQDQVPFKATLAFEGMTTPLHLRSIPAKKVQVVCVSPQQLRTFAARLPSPVDLQLERSGLDDKDLKAQLWLLPVDGLNPQDDLARGPASVTPTQARRRVAIKPDATALLTNGIGGMARLCVDLGAVQSKYDCLLGANLHPECPVDRHVFAKRARVWVNADGFISPLNGENLVDFEPGPPAWWRFVASAGDGRTVEIQLTVDMLPGVNTTVLRFHRPATAPLFGSALPLECEVRLTVRVDIEDRSFHTETHLNGGAEFHFTAHCRPMPDPPGFFFAPAADRLLRVYADHGHYHPEAEWCRGLYHPIEAARGQIAHGDAYSPGWFELPLGPGRSIDLVATAEAQAPDPNRIAGFAAARRDLIQQSHQRAMIGPEDPFGQRLVSALQAFIVRRRQYKTVIAGYPWFLDWGRDTLVCARGMLAAGLGEEVRQLLVLYGGLEKAGTLPNSFHGDDTSNRDTSDAPLWFGLACEEASAFFAHAHRHKPAFYELKVGDHGRTLREVLRSIAVHYCQGTPNGMRLDPASGLIWSPAHFTWMDTQYPACTPREGYPIEIQALWIRLLRQLERLGIPAGQQPWGALAHQAETSLASLFWLEDRDYFADLILAKPGQPASQGVVDTSLRSNFLFGISLGLITGSRARRGIHAAQRYLLVPGGVRSLAPLPVTPSHPIYSSDGRLLNNPHLPYWGIYEGDEDTRRKPAYHNGTAWTWLLPVFCESLVRAWDYDLEAVRAARAYLHSMDTLLREKCQGQAPEVLDGDAPHRPRGCDAQAWAVSETLRVWKLLASPPPRSANQP
jgi:predicted glycogen debranching enzyme